MRELFQVERLAAVIAEHSDRDADYMRRLGAVAYYAQLEPGEKERVRDAVAAILAAQPGEPPKPRVRSKKTENG